MAQLIPKDFIDNLLEKSNIVEIISNYIKLDKKGNDYWARCPFHSEKTSSFSVSENKQFFYCFGCGAKGNSIGFVMDHSNKTYPEAIETIANLMSMEIPRDKEAAKIYESKKIIQNSLNDTKNIFENNLKKSTKAISYLKQRNISGETAKLFGIGYAEDDFQILNKRLKDKYSETNLFDAGLIVKKDNNSYDKFRDRIMFPIHDTTGNMIAFGGRVISEDKEKPIAKYMNSPETSLFSKKRVLYNLHLAKKEKVSKDFIYVVEGYMDVIALHQAGVKNSVATLGTAVTEENLSQCFKYTREIICCFDGDKAGEKAAWQGVENIMKVIKDGDAISFVFLPENNDPDNIIEKGGKKLWEEFVDKKISIEEFVYKKFSKESDLNTATGKTQYLQKVDKLLEKLQAKILKGILSESLRDKVGAKYISKGENKKVYLKDSRYKATSPLQKSILILMHHPKMSIDESLVNDMRIKDNPGVILLKSIINLIKENSDMNMGRIIENFREEKVNYNSLEKISRIPIADYEHPSKELHACLYLVIRNHLKDKIKDMNPANLKEYSVAQKEIRDIEEKSKNF